MGLSERDKKIMSWAMSNLHFDQHNRILFFSLFKQGFDDPRPRLFAPTCCFSSTIAHIHTFCKPLPVWQFRSVMFKSSRPSPPPTLLLLLYICQREAQQEENRTMIHQQQERLKEKQHVKGRWDEIQLRLVSAARRNKSSLDDRRGR